MHRIDALWKRGGNVNNGSTPAQRSRPKALAALACRAVAPFDLEYRRGAARPTVLLQTSAINVIPRRLLPPKGSCYLRHWQPHYWHLRSESCQELKASLANKAVDRGDEEPDDVSTPPRIPFDSEAAGVAMYGASAACMAAMHVGVKLSVKEGLSVPLVILSRTVFGIVAALLVLLIAGKNPLGTRRGMLLSRGLVGTGGVIGALYASSCLPLVVVSLLSFTSPIATAAAASVALNEPFPKPLILAAVASIIGMLLLLEPWSALTAASSSRLNPVGLIAAAASPCCIGFASVLVRKLSTSGTPEHPQVVMLYLSAVTAVLAVLLCKLTPGALSPPAGAMSSAMPFLLLVGVAGWLSQLFMTMSLARAPAAVASSMGYTQLVYTILADALIFGTVLRGGQLAGASVILVSTLGLAAQRFLGHRRQKQLASS